MLAPLLLVASLTLPQVVINEYTASNVDELRTESGETPDWIELLNQGSTAVDLTGWGLSDDPLQPFRWTFPPCEILPGEYLLVYASGDDKRVFINERKTVVGIGDEWRYLEPTSEPAANWRLPGFDDSGWLQGPAGFGKGDGDDSTVLSGDVVFARKSFQLNATTLHSLATLDFHVDFDDGYALYLNGQEISRKYLDHRFSQTPFDELASESHEAQLYRGKGVTGVRIDQPADYLVVGLNTVALQVHNEAIGDDDLSCIPFITIGRFVSDPKTAVAPGLIFDDPELHTNFRLAAMGEDLLLTQADGTLVEHIQTGQMYTNISRGRHPQGLPGQFYFAVSTPGAENSTLAESRYSEAVTVTPPGGGYAGAVSVSLSHPSPAAEIRYTLDGSEPSEQSTLYSGPITPPGPVGILRARAFETGKWPSWPTSDTYLAGISAPLPVYSLITDPPNLWDDDIGIYAHGPNAQPWWPYRGANFYLPWERPVHVELIEADGTVPLRFDGGIMIHGGASRSFPQKSLRILARGGYGAERQEYRQFASRGYDSLKRTILRNGGTDWAKGILRDGFANRVLEHVDLETSNFRPAIILLNGEYWGMQNLRERQDEWYLENRFDIDEHSVDILEADGKSTEGDSDHYDQMLQFIRDNPVSDPANYAHVQTLMDTSNFARYFACEIFYANPDWPKRNIKYWRPRTEDGRWRWIFFDLDNGLAKNADYDDKTLQRVTSGSGWETFLFRSLLGNADFRQEFINGYADLLNSALLPSRSVPILNQMVAEIDPEIDRHYNRWLGSRAGWEQELALIETFMIERPAHARAHMMSRFGLSGEYNLDLAVQPEGAGYLKLTNIDVCDAFSGIYFLGNPVKIEAVPAPGYAFDSWSDPLLPNSEVVSIDPAGNYTLSANFNHVDSAPVINEINYSSAANFDPGDWVEIYNNSDASLDLSGWRLADSGNTFTIPPGTIVAPRDYLVLCRKLNDFQLHFPNVSNVIGEFNFGLSSKGELVQLLDPSLQVIDELEYNNQPRWPIPATGQGPTLELRQPGLDNSNASNWRASTGHGTPGQRNSARP